MNRTYYIVWVEFGTIRIDARKNQTVIIVSLHSNIYLTARPEMMFNQTAAEMVSKQQNVSVS